MTTQNFYGHVHQVAGRDIRNEGAQLTYAHLTTPELLANWQARHDRIQAVRGEQKWNRSLWYAVLIGALVIMYIGWPQAGSWMLGWLVAGAATLLVLRVDPHVGRADIVEDARVIAIIQDVLRNRPDWRPAAND
ncbi:MAG: hypothetical protein WDA70_03740 [Lysobacteraceae bacterium]